MEIIASSHRCEAKVAKPAKEWFFRQRVEPICGLPRQAAQICGDPTRRHFKSRQERTTTVAIGLAIGYTRQNGWLLTCQT
jgi:hypothetical protein